MRTITIVVDDVGNTEVKICFDVKTKQFFTKREFDRALRAAKLQYRLQKREYRREQIIKQSVSMTGENHERKERSEQEVENRSPRVERKREASGGGAQSLQDALRAKTERNRRAKAGETS